MSEGPFTLSQPVEHARGHTCLNCGEYLTGSAGIVEQGDSDVIVTPSPGDISICVKCQHVMAFDERMQMRELSEDERDKAFADERILASMQALRQAKQAYERDKREKLDAEYRSAHNVAVAEKLVAEIEPILHSNEPEAIGAALAELTAKLFAGLNPALRAPIMREHLRCVRDMVPLYDRWVKKTGAR